MNAADPDDWRGRKCGDPPPTTSPAIVAAVTAFFLLAPLVTAQMPDGPPTPVPTLGTWMETAKLTPDDADDPGPWGASHTGVNFGSDIALDGDTLVVGTQWSKRWDAGAANGQDGYDRAYVFQRTADGGWTQTAELRPDNPQLGDTFAYSVALDSESGVIIAGNPAAETIHIFERAEPGTWTQTKTFHRPCPDGLVDCFGTDDTQDIGFGFDVAVSGHTVAAGIHEMYVFEEVDDMWTETATLRGGIHVALEGDTLVTSVWHPAANSNEMAVYHRGADSWIEETHLDPGDEYESQNTHPARVDVSDTEDAIILGAPVDRRVYGVQTEPAGAGFFAHGSAWIYEKTDDGWQQTADIPNPDPGPSQEVFGIAVAIDAGRAVVGASGDLHNGADHAGATYVYEKEMGHWGLVSKLRNHDGGVAENGDRFGWAVDVSEETTAVGAPFDDNRRDGTPWPADDDGDVPPCLEPNVIDGCDEGQNAGSAYIFEGAISSAESLQPRTG